jgi:hypothetical protein
MRLMLAAPHPHTHTLAAAPRTVPRALLLLLLLLLLLPAPFPAAGAKDDAAIRAYFAAAAAVRALLEAADSLERHPCETCLKVRAWVGLGGRMGHASALPRRCSECSAPALVEVCIAPCGW